MSPELRRNNFLRLIRTRTLSFTNSYDFYDNIKNLYNEEATPAIKLVKEQMVRSALRDCLNAKKELDKIMSQFEINEQKNWENITE